MSVWDEIDDFAVENLSCSYCGVRQGHECRTVTSNKPARYTHAAREWEIRDMLHRAWREGYSDGAEGMQRRMRWEAERASERT